ncbi:MAG: glutathione synthetase large chain [Lasallia pustulata]|uniref:Glutathione synthetase large chain n=2 Tax=Lasallia pustulata TaxID=136370 RepID=A0A5M8PU36_9LECA|nr:MAG: glutathione synthetase large chain [Lasallia pustulata]
MAASIYPDFPPQLTEEQSDYLITTLKDWSIAHGLAVRPSPAFVSKNIDPSGVLAVTAPVTLFPSPFPRSCFEEAKAIQVAYNELYAAIARDEEWLGGIVEELLEVDDFIASLWDVHLAVKKEGYVQDLSLGLFRSDYMVHVDPSTPSARPQIKQVEFNTIASSFGGLSSQVSRLHKHLLATSAYPPTSPPIIKPDALPTNPSTSSLSLGLATAHKHYGPSKSTPPLPLCIIFIVQSPERNVFDQRHLEYSLQTTHSIPTFRLPFPATLTQTHIPPTNPSRPLIFTPPTPQAPPTKPQPSTSAPATPPPTTSPRTPGPRASTSNAAPP